MIRRRAPLLFTAMLVVACGSSESPSDGCAEVSERIFGGTSDGGTPDVDGVARGAVVALDEGDGVPVCTATVVDRGWALTAAHCKREEPLLLRAPLAGWEAPAKLLVPHPRLDAMLVQFDSQRGSTTLSLETVPPDASWIGKKVQMTGYGRTEQGVRGDLRFVDESVTDVQSDEIWVDGKGVSGACDGDSGGPLLVTDPGGVPRVAGVLSRGSSDCHGVDIYVRMSALTDWLSGELPAGTCGRRQGQ